VPPRTCLLSAFGRDRSDYVRVRGRRFRSSYRDDAEAFAAGCCQDLWEGLEGVGWVGDAVVEDDYGSGGEIFCYEPADEKAAVMVGRFGLVPAH